MKLTILGNNGPFPAAGGACSGYLLQSGGTNILIDCGNGVLANLQKFIRYEELDAIILTHLHSDHISDLYVLKYAVQIKRKRGQLDRILKVFAPPEPVEEYARLDVKDAFQLEPVDVNTKLVIGDISISFAAMRHPVMDFAVKFECDGKCFVFSGDTSWTDEIVSFSRGADFLMLDAGLLEKDFTEGAPHLTAAQCGIAAQQAGVKKLLLTHFWPEYEPNDLLQEAMHSFANTETSELLHTYEI